MGDVEQYVLLNYLNLATVPTPSGSLGHPSTCGPRIHPIPHKYFFMACNYVATVKVTSFCPY
jgi:hypothetical protein